jgi:apolipoprotein N-acyltransferase
MSLFARRIPSPKTPHQEAWQRRVWLMLCVLSGLMLGFSFPPSQLGVLACFGLVPLLIVLADVRETGRALRYSYVALLVFHIITLNWTGGYTHGNDPYMMIAGAVTMLAHPFFYFIPIGIYCTIRRYLGEWLALVSLPLSWLAYEYTHSLSEWSFPWLAIGNSQSYNLAGMQFISITGIYGLSFWILIINVLAFVLYSRIAHGVWSPRSSKAVLMGLGIVILYYVPALYGNAVLVNAPLAPDGLKAGQKAITVGMIQSNIDPWEKWKQAGFDHLELYLDMTDSLVNKSSLPRPDLVLWPETAVPYAFLAPIGSPTLQFLRSRIDRIGVPVLTGFKHVVFYDDSTKAPPGAKRLSDGQRYDSYNAAALIEPFGGEVPWYGKMKMVPLAERIPYAEAFYFLDFLRWSVGAGGWKVGKDSVIFVERRTGARFNTIICYESVYPDLVAAFVKRGAQFIALITIDSWWGKMSGAYQHQRFSVFRAVENRRWIARCAVGGISCYIDPYGREYDKTELFTQAILSRSINLSDDLTFYSTHGDWLAIGCVFLTGFLFAAAIGVKVTARKRNEAWTRNS